jgi:hypothetical protein
MMWLSNTPTMESKMWLLTIYTLLSLSRLGLYVGILLIKNRYAKWIVGIALCTIVAGVLLVGVVHTRKELTVKRAEIVSGSGSLSDFANAHRYFGFHKTGSGWVYREWAPGAETMYLTGDFCGWDRHAYPMEKKDGKWVVDEDGDLVEFISALTGGIGVDEH